MKNVQIPESLTLSSELQKIIDDNGNTATQFIFNAGQQILCKSLIHFYNNAEIVGNGAIFTLMDNAPVTIFGNSIPMIGAKSLNNVSGLNFHDFTVDGNYQNQKGKGASTQVSGTDHGKGYGNAIGLGDITNPQPTNVTDCIFTNLTFQNSQGDGIRIEGATDLTFTGIKSRKGGHDVIHLNNVHGAEISGCEVWMRTNNFVRTRSAWDIKIHNNVVHGTSEAYAPGIQIESISANHYSARIAIYENFIENTLGPGIWIVGSVPGNKDVSIWNNLLLRCGQMPAANKIPGAGGIIADGFDNVRIRFNTIDCSYGYGVGFAKYQNASTLSCTSKIEGNIISNTDKSFYPGAYSGCAIANVLKNYTVTAVNNCLWNNESDYYNCSGSGDVFKDPLFVGAGDYHLKSTGGHYTASGAVKDTVTSPCVFPDHEYGCYNNTSQKSVYLPPDPPTVMISQPNADLLKALVSSLIEHGYIEETDIVGYKNV